MSARAKGGGKARGSGDEAGVFAPPPRFDLERGDSVELAQRLLVDLQAGDAPAPIVFDLGAFWRYAAARGVWEKVPDEAATRVLATYAGALVPGARGKPKALRLSAGDIAGAIRVAAKLAAQPGFFNAAPRGVAFANGFVAIAVAPDPEEPARVIGRAVLREHSPDHRATFALPCAYDAAAPAARWARFLDEIWTPPEEGDWPAEARAAGERDRMARARALEEWVGAALLGEVTRHQVCLILIGSEGANGKSELLKVLRKLFPPDAVRSIAPHEWQRGFQRAELAGARLNLVNELPDADVAGGDLFKAIVAGDAVAAERKYSDPFTLESRAGHLFACNVLPGTKDQSGGYWRRWLVLPFERTFERKDWDLALEATLAGELPGIAARVLAAAARLAARGHMLVPESSEEAKRRWQLDVDQVRAFLDECADGCAPAPRGPCHPKACPDHRETRDDLYPVFAVWLRANGHRPMAKNTFANRLKMLKLERRTELERWYAVKLRDAARRRYGLGPTPPTSGGFFHHNPDRMTDG